MRPDDALYAGDLEIRRHRRSDAAALNSAILESIDHLKPWMPWADREPLTVEDREHLIVDVFGPGWDDETDFSYGLFLDGEVVGGCGLHRRTVEGGLEIGYWTRAGHLGRGLATSAARELSAAAFRLGEITHVEIHHDKANVASGRVPAKLGFVLVREVRDEISAPGEVGLSCEWRLDRPSA